MYKENHNSEWKDFETLESHIYKQQKLHPQGRGIFSNILRRIGVASKIIESKVRRAGLLGITGKEGIINIQGEDQMKLDLLSNNIMKAAFNWWSPIAGICSEEEDEFVTFPKQNDYSGDRYIIFFDPLDGSSNIDTNVPIGTIFSIYRYEEDSKNCILQPGHQQKAAGYVLYGSTTMFVYTTGGGSGVHGFTLDPEIGEYVLSHENIIIPPQCKYFSANETNYQFWSTNTQRYADFIRFGYPLLDIEFADECNSNNASINVSNKISSRYTGTLVSDFHRNLLKGGIFLYPEDIKAISGKLRLLYECAPLALIAEEAGGMASTGTKRILDLQATSLHQRVPFIIGNKNAVLLYLKNNTTTFSPLYATNLAEQI
ncbi:MAG: class 1 fructose-bisphosphatase [Oligoflexia bacterium]|nr:class 1 fructose-bisphosphatase [Oligoflexia bacterium]